LQHLKLKYDEPLSKFCFHFQLVPLHLGENQLTSMPEEWNEGGGGGGAAAVGFRV